MKPPRTQVGVVQALGGSPGDRILNKCEILEPDKVSGRFRTGLCFSFVTVDHNFLHKHWKADIFNVIYEVPWHAKSLQNNCWHFPTVHVSRAWDKSKVLWLLVKRITAITKGTVGNWEMELLEQTHNNNSEMGLGSFCPSRKENKTSSATS